MADQQTMFAHFDAQNARHLRLFIAALEYMIFGGNDAQASSIKKLGSDPQRRSDRRRSVRGMYLRVDKNPEFAGAVEGFRDAYTDSDGVLIAAAAALEKAFGGMYTASPADDSQGPASKKQRASRTSTSSNGSPSPSSSLTPSTSDTSSSKARGRHAPNLQKGYECWDDGSFDRSRANVGEPDSSKFHIALSSRKRDPKAIGGYKIGNGAVYDYPGEKGILKNGVLTPFDWDSPKHVEKLHQWREQIFRRRIGGVRPTRANWLESEKYYTLNLIREQLKTHHRIKFNKLTNDFNRRFHGTTQRRGERQVFSGKAKNGGILEQNRPSPWRTTSALEGQTHKWAEVKEMISQRDRERRDAAQEGDENIASSDDEAEIPNPDPPQTVFRPRKYKPWVGKQAVNEVNAAKRALKKSAKKAESAATSNPDTPTSSIAQKRKHSDTSEEIKVEARGEVDESEDEYGSSDIDDELSGPGSSDDDALSGPEDSDSE